MFQDGREHTFVTYWTSGEPKLVSFIAEIIGQDPSFGFPRVCDQTPETKVFQPDNAYLRQALVSIFYLVCFFLLFQFNLNNRFNSHGIKNKTN